jgi:hypothetical protein
MARTTRTCVLAGALISPLFIAHNSFGSFSLGSGANYGLLYEGNGGHNFSYNNSNETGNIGLGGTGHFQGNGPGTITGLIDFSAPNTGQFSNSGLTLVPSANNPVYSVSDVTSALTTLNSLSQTLGLEAGTSTTITSGGSITASGGTPDGSGNDVFNVTSISFPNGTFTINGGPNDFVVLNIADGVGNNGLNGSVVLAGGIASDHVLFNYTPATTPLSSYNADYSSLSGGPTMTISTNGLTTTGVFLDPTGNFQVNHSNINGRVIGGDSSDSGFVSGANLTAPVPEPSAILIGLGSLVWAGFRRPRR